MPNSTILLPLGGFKTWHISQISFGPGSPPGTVVPKVKDMIVDYDRGIYYVKAIVNQVPILERFDVTKNIVAETHDGLINGLSGNTANVASRAFINDSVVPNVITLDDTYVIKGSDYTYCKLFKGSDVTDSGTVISRNFSGSSENILLEPVLDGNNALKRPNAIYTNASLDDGELVTLVLYTSVGGAGGVHPFIITNTAAIKTLEMESVRIEDIALISPYLSITENDVLEVPFGMPLSTSGFSMRLIYNNGTTVDRNIDGVKAKILGLDNYNTNWAGDGEAIVLQYHADIDEPIVNVTSGLNRSISRTYIMRNVVVDVDYAYQFYISPTYNPVTQQYTLELWLVNAAHDTIMNLTEAGIAYSIVLAGTQANPNLSAGSGWQQLDVIVDIGAIWPGMGDYVFTQTTGINLSAVTGNTDNRPWMIDYGNDRDSAYGNTNAFRAIAHLGGNKPIYLTASSTTQEIWLNRLYYSLYPTYDHEQLAEVPVPTHFKLRWPNGAGYSESSSIDIDLWNAPIYRNSHDLGDWTNFDTVHVIWQYKRAGDITFRNIAVAPLCVRISQV